MGPAGTSSAPGYQRAPSSTLTPYLYSQIASRCSAAADVLARSRRGLAICMARIAGCGAARPGYVGERASRSSRPIRSHTTLPIIAPRRRFLLALLSVRDWGQGRQQFERCDRACAAAVVTTPCPGPTVLETKARRQNGIPARRDNRIRREARSMAASSTRHLPGVRIACARRVLAWARCPEPDARLDHWRLPSTSETGVGVSQVSAASR